VPVFFSPPSYCYTSPYNPFCHLRLHILIRTLNGFCVRLFLFGPFLQAYFLSGCHSGLIISSITYSIIILFSCTLCLCSISNDLRTLHQYAFCPVCYILVRYLELNATKKNIPICNFLFLHGALYMYGSLVCSCYFYVAKLNEPMTQHSTETISNHLFQGGPNVERITML